MAPHSSTLAWKIQGPGEPGGLPSVGSHRVEHDWSDLTAAATVSIIVPNHNHFVSDCGVGGRGVSAGSRLYERESWTWPLTSSVSFLIFTIMTIIVFITESLWRSRSLILFTHTHTHTHTHTNAGDPGLIPELEVSLERDRLPSPVFLGFPGGSDNKESACNVGDLGLIPGLGRSPGGGHGNPLQYSCLENPHRQRSLVGYSPWGHKDLDLTEQLSVRACTHTHTHTHTHTSIWT